MVCRNLMLDSQNVLLLWGAGEEGVIQTIQEEVNRLENRGISGAARGKLLIPPKTSLLELAALIRKCSSVIALDNGPKNIAVALQIPTLTITGPTNPLSFNPHDNPAHAVLRDEKLFCIACGLNKCPYKHECMTNISENMVIKAVRPFLKKTDVSFSNIVPPL